MKNAKQVVSCSEWRLYAVAVLRLVFNMCGMIHMEWENLAFSPDARRFYRICCVPGSWRWFTTASGIHHGRQLAASCSCGKLGA